MKHSAPLREILNRMQSYVGDSTKRPHHNGINQTVSSLVQAVEQLEKLAASRSPMETEAMHATRVHQAARRLEETAQAADARIQGSVRAGVIDLSAAIEAKAGLREDAYASEIRATLRALPEKQRLEEVNRALAKGEASIIAAIAKAPQTVTGLPGDHRDRVVEEHQKKVAPAEYQARNDLLDMLSTSLVAVSTAKKAAQSATDPAYIEEIQKADEKAKAAQHGFDAALTF